MERIKIVCLAVAACAVACAAQTGVVSVAECERDPSLDVWAAPDAAFARRVMDDVFRKAGLEMRFAPFAQDGMFAVSNAEVVLSAFRTPALLKDYDFPLQPLGRMHFALYATPARAAKMMAVRITDWPKMRVGCSPVSQGRNDDRERYFRHANLQPDYVEYPTSAEAVQALHGGAVDVLFLYTPDGKRPEGLVEVVPIGARNVYFAVRKDRPQLLKRLSAAYRDRYIDHVDMYDAWRKELLGTPKPKNRVRIAAYSRGHLFDVTPDGDRTGILEDWFKAICEKTRWTADYVYGDYEESLNDVVSGRLDLVGGLEFAASRREKFFFPHTPVGILRIFLWAHHGSRFKAGDPSTWRGMRVGLLAGALSAVRVRERLESADLDISVHAYATDQALNAAYFAGEVDACVNMEMPALDNELALHIYASHPMYICATQKRPELFNVLEQALDDVCDDFPKYMKMITERHYGMRNEMSMLTLKEASWLRDRLKDPRPVMIDFSPWPVPLKDRDGRLTHFAAAFLGELEKRTGLNFDVCPQTGIQTAEARFLRGDTDLWIPYPERFPAADSGAVSVFSVPVPENYAASVIGAEDRTQEFEMWANHAVPDELVAVLRKAVSAMDPMQIQEMFMQAAAERKVVHRVFGFTREELTHVIMAVVAAILLVVAVYGTVMAALLKRQARRANKAAQEAEEHAQAKTRFLAMMSHELRTPLNAVIGFAEFLSREDVDEARRQEYTEGILLSASALLELINDILDLSKLEAGAMNMRSGTCDMNQLLRELPAIFGYRVRRHGVKLTMETVGSEAIPAVVLSQQGMRQILINLVGNAAKFTEKGDIAVRAGWDPAGRTLRLEVHDTGCGMSEEKMAHLFDPFVQDIATRMKAHVGDVGGTGLGLPIVKRMVDAAHGTITAKSTLQKGTSFIIEIPGLTVVENVPSASRSAEETIRSAMPERVLVVDDMAMNRKILGIHLGNLQIKDIRYAEDGKQALEVMNEWLPDLVLSDMWMPNMDGTQLAEAMRHDRRLAEIPIVAVTADVDVGSTYDISLFAKVIAKPVTADKLRALFGEIVYE